MCVTDGDGADQGPAAVWRPWVRDPWRLDGVANYAPPTAPMPGRRGTTSIPTAQEARARGHPEVGVAALATEVSVFGAYGPGLGAAR